MGTFCPKNPNFLRIFGGKLGIFGDVLGIIQGNLGKIPEIPEIPEFWGELGQICEKFWEKFGNFGANLGNFGEFLPPKFRIFCGFLGGISVGKFWKIGEFWEIWGKLEEN